MSIIYYCLRKNIFRLSKGSRALLATLDRAPTTRFYVMVQVSMMRSWSENDLRDMLR